MPVSCCFATTHHRHLEWSVRITARSVFTENFAVPAALIYMETSEDDIASCGTIRHRKWQVQTVLNFSCITELSRISKQYSSAWWLWLFCKRLPRRGASITPVSTGFCAPCCLQCARVLSNSTSCYLFFIIENQEPMQSELFFRI